MPDVFLSYSSKDRDRVAPLRESLVALGYEVFWDQHVPAGMDWDTWIRGELAKSRCAVVVWSENSVISSNVRHEATVAEDARKLVPVLIDSLGASQFPMGLYNVQAANLVGWTGQDSNSEWRKLIREIEARIKPHAPLWLQTSINALEANLMAEKARVQSAENRVRTMEDKIARDAGVVLDAERERNKALEQLSILSKRIAEQEEGKASAILQGKALEQRLEAAEVERVALAERLGISSDGKTNKTASRGHIWLVDALLIAAAAAVLFAAAERNIPNESLAVAGAVAAGWSIVSLIRLAMRRVIKPLTVTAAVRQPQNATTIPAMPEQKAAADPPSDPTATTSGRPVVNPQPEAATRTIKIDETAQNWAYRIGQVVRKFSAGRSAG